MKRLIALLVLLATFPALAAPEAFLYWRPDQNSDYVRKSFSPAEGLILTFNAQGEPTVVAITSASGGDVIGPASSVAGRIPAFSNTTGKMLTDSGYAASDFFNASNLNTGLVPLARLSGSVSLLGQSIALNELQVLTAGKFIGRVGSDGEAQQLGFGPEFAFSGQNLVLATQYQEEDANLIDLTQGEYNLPLDLKQGYTVAGPTFSRYLPMVGNTMDLTRWGEVRNLTSNGNALAFSGSGGEGQAYHLWLHADGSERTITFVTQPWNGSVNVPSITVGANQDVFVVLYRLADKWLIINDPVATSGTGAFLRVTGATASGLKASPHVYGIDWNGNDEVPTKNDLYDKISTLGAGGGGGGLNYQGEWATGTPYLLDDAVKNHRGSFIAKAAHTSSAATQPGVGASWNTVWDQFVDLPNFPGNRLTFTGPLGSLTTDVELWYDDDTNTFYADNMVIGGLFTDNLYADSFQLQDTAADHTLRLVSGENLTTNRTLTFSTQDGNRTVVFPQSLTAAGTDVQNAWADDVPQIYNPGATREGVNVGSVTADPTAPANGGLWYRSDLSVIKARVGGADKTIPLTTLADDPLWSAKGDLAVATADNASAVLPLGVNGQVLTVDTSTATGTKWAAAAGGSSDSIASRRQNIVLWEEFIGISGSGTFGELGLLREVTGGTVASGLPTSSPPASGVMNLYTSTGTTNKVGVMSNASGFSILFGGGTYVWETRVNIETLPVTTTNEYVFRAGFLDAISAQPTDGCYFQYDAANANWFAVCRSAGSESGSITNTSVAVTNNAWITLRIEINAAATQALFYINGTLVRTETTNIPSGSNSRGTSIGAGVVKSTGSVDNDFFFDYMGLEIGLTTSR